MTEQEPSAIEARIGGRIRIARTRRKLTAQDLAERAGVHPNTIYRLETGSNCSVASLYRIASALGLTLTELLP